MDRVKEYTQVINGNTSLASLVHLRKAVSCDTSLTESDRAVLTTRIMDREEEIKILSRMNLL